ncbi:MAG: GNAT family N-acetyltransferase [Phycisphaerales bacterium JB050]
MRISIEREFGADVLALLNEHIEDMRRISPPESKHAFDADSLRIPEITFFTAREDGELLGCGALLDLGGGVGEIKSMRTSRRHLRRGVAAAILSEIISTSRGHDMTRLCLETGTQTEFVPARSLYSRFGFTDCGPFGNYTEDANSVFMDLELSRLAE